MEHQFPVAARAKQKLSYLPNSHECQLSVVGCRLLVVGLVSKSKMEGLDWGPKAAGGVSLHLS